MCLPATSIDYDGFRSRQIEDTDAFDFSFHNITLTFDLVIKTIGSSAAITGRLLMVD